MQKQTLDDSDDSVGIMVQLTFESKFEAAVSEAQIKFADAASLFPGHIKSESKKIARSQQSMTSVIAMHCFESTDHLIRWLESDRRKSLMQAFDQRFRDHVKVRYPQATDGFSAWTGEGADNTTPKSSFFLRMKTNLLVLTALYPLTLLLPLLLHPVLPGMSRPTITLLTAIAAVTLLGFLLVPFLNRRMRFWLYTDRVSTNFLGATGLIIFIVMVWQVARALMH